MLRNGRYVQPRSDSRRHDEVLRHADTGSSRHTVRILHDAGPSLDFGFVQLHGVQVRGVVRQHGHRIAHGTLRNGRTRVLDRFLLDGDCGVVFHAQDDGQQHPHGNIGHRTEARGDGLGLRRIPVRDDVVRQPNEILVKERAFIHEIEYTSYRFEQLSSSPLYFAFQSGMSYY